MAMLGCGAPVPEPRLQNIRTLLEKIRGDIPAVLSSWLPSEFLKINASEHVVLNSTIRIPPAPVLEALSQSVTLEASLMRISQGLQLHQALLANICKALDPKCQDLPLLYDIRDLDDQISEIVGGQAAEESKVTLYMPGMYYVEKAAHLTLLQLDKFLQDVQQFLMGLD